jgi:hypothetical protein
VLSKSNSDSPYNIVGCYTRTATLKQKVVVGRFAKVAQTNM